MEEKVILEKREKAVSYNPNKKEIYFHKYTFKLEELYEVVKIVEQKEKESING
jgi:hypothetical protein